jgi:hypothetical protein
MGRLGLDGLDHSEGNAGSHAEGGGQSEQGGSDPATNVRVHVSSFTPTDPVPVFLFVV